MYIYAWYTRARGWNFAEITRVSPLREFTCTVHSSIMNYVFHGSLLNERPADGSAVPRNTRFRPYNYCIAVSHRV